MTIKYIFFAFGTNLQLVSVNFIQAGGIAAQTSWKPSNQQINKSTKKLCTFAKKQKPLIKARVDVNHLFIKKIEKLKEDKNRLNN